MYVCLGTTLHVCEYTSACVLCIYWYFGKVVLAFPVYTHACVHGVCARVCVCVRD